MATLSSAVVAAAAAAKVVIITVARITSSLLGGETILLTGWKCAKTFWRQSTLLPSLLYFTFLLHSFSSSPALVRWRPTVVWAGRVAGQITAIHTGGSAWHNRVDEKSVEKLASPHTSSSTTTEPTKPVWNSAFPSGAYLLTLHTHRHTLFVPFFCLWWRAFL